MDLSDRVFKRRHNGRTVVLFEEEWLTLSQLAERTGINQFTLKARLDKHSSMQALVAPPENHDEEIFDDDYDENRELTEEELFEGLEPEVIDIMKRGDIAAFMRL